MKTKLAAIYFAKIRVQKLTPKTIIFSFFSQAKYTPNKLVQLLSKFYKSESLSSLTKFKDLIFKTLG